MYGHPMCVWQWARIAAPLVSSPLNSVGFFSTRQEACQVVAGWWASCPGVPCEACGGCGDATFEEGVESGSVVTPGLSLMGGTASD